MRDNKFMKNPKAQFRLVGSLVLGFFALASALAQDAKKPQPAPAAPAQPAAAKPTPAAPAPTAAAPVTPPTPQRNIRFQFDGIPYADVIERFAQMANKPLLADTNISGTLTFNDPNTYTYE